MNRLIHPSLIIPGFCLYNVLMMLDWWLPDCFSVKSPIELFSYDILVEEDWYRFELLWLLEFYSYSIITCSLINRPSSLYFTLTFVSKSSSYILFPLTFFCIAFFRNYVIYWLSANIFSRKRVYFSQSLLKFFVILWLKLLEIKLAAAFSSKSINILFS